MKKVMFVVVSLLLVSYCFALESAPSNKVGYYKFQATAGAANQFSYTYFGLPFKFWDVPTGTNIPTYGVESRKPSDILGNQAFCGNATTADRVSKLAGNFGYRSSTSSCNWTNSLETLPADMEPGRAYYYRTFNQPTKDIVLAGEADTTAAGIPTVSIVAGTIAAPAYVGYSWRDPRDLARATVNLLAQGFACNASASSSDRVAGIGSGGFFTHNCTNFVGTLATLTAGKAYYIINKHGAAYNYTYLATGVPIIGGGSNEGQMQKISNPMTKTTTVKSGTAAK